MLGQLLLPLNLIGMSVLHKPGVTHTPDIGVMKPKEEQNEGGTFAGLATASK